MKIGIVGSRSRKDRETVEKFVRSLAETDIVISGGCRGVDTWAETAAKKRGLKTVIFKPKMPAKGAPRYEFTKAFYARNQLIAETCDVLAAFVSSDRKGGTENTVKHAQKAGKKIILIHPNQSLEHPQNRPNQGPDQLHFPGM